MPPSIFINYRREDTLAMASRLRSELSKQFGPNAVFIDHQISGGAVWTDEIRDTVKNCKVMFSLVGSKWLTVHGEHGQRRLDTPEDWVACEIEEALKTEGKIIPVLVEDAEPIPQEALKTLPKIHKFADIQACKLRSESWEEDFGCLLNTVKKRGLQILQQDDVAKPKMEKRVFIVHSRGDLDVHGQNMRLLCESWNWETIASSDSLSEAKAALAECDILICLVAHRYGVVPSIDEGGDEERSFTWLLVEEAKRIRKPVAAFVAAPDSLWKESDFEGIRNPIAGERLRQFKKSIQQITVGEISSPESLLGDPELHRILVQKLEEGEDAKEYNSNSQLANDVIISLGSPEQAMETVIEETRRSTRRVLHASASNRIDITSLENPEELACVLNRFSDLRRKIVQDGQIEYQYLTNLDDPRRKHELVELYETRVGEQFSAWHFSNSQGVGTSVNYFVLDHDRVIFAAKIQPRGIRFFLIRSNEFNRMMSQLFRKDCEFATKVNEGEYERLKDEG